MRFYQSVLLLLWRSRACIPKGAALLSVLVAGACAGGFGGAVAPPTTIRACEPEVYFQHLKRHCVVTTFGVGAILRPLEITNRVHVLLLLWRSRACIPKGTALLSVLVAGASAGGSPPNKRGHGACPQLLA